MTPPFETGVRDCFLLRDPVPDLVFAIMCEKSRGRMGKQPTMSPLAISAVLENRLDMS